jgi:hypothetical protein
VWITDAGRRLVLDDTYRPPACDGIPRPLVYRVGDSDRWRVQDRQNGSGLRFLSTAGTWDLMDSSLEWGETHWHTWDTAVALALAAQR